jgi:hypothetical protein
VKRFVDFVDKQGEEFERKLEHDPDKVVQMLKKVGEDMQREERRNDVSMD